MAKTWCLPKDVSAAFLKAITDGTLSRERLRSMTSEERRAEFGKIIGDDLAREVNERFEKTLLLKNQKQAYLNWVKKQTTMSEAARRDISARIAKMDRILNPAEERAFMADLAAMKLGVGVTPSEAKTIFDLAQAAEKLRAEISAKGGGDYRQGWTVESGTAYGRAQQALRDQIESLKPGGKTIGHWFINVLNFPKSVLTSILHWSAPFVQGWGMISTRQWWEGLGQMFQYFASEDKYEALNGYILGHPDYELARTGKLGLTHLGDRLTTREEAIQSSLLEGANEWLSDRTGVPNLIRAWSRSFTGFLNYIRFNRFTQLLDAARAGGEDVSIGSKVVSDLALVVNNFTGRGELGSGDRFATVGAVLNALFFSPRKLVATVEMFNPVAYAKLSPIARQAAIRQLAGSLVATGAVLTLAKVSGAKVTMDPRSSDFGKFEIAGLKFDMTGGNAAYLRLLARIATGQAVSAQGHISTTVSVRGNTMPTRVGAPVNFMLGKLAPVAATIADALFGKDPSGRAFNVTDTIRDEFMPIVINSFIQDVGNNPDWYVSALPALSALLGVGLESPEPPMSASGRDAFGDPIPGTNAFWGTSPGSFGGPGTWYTDPVVKESRAVGLQLRPVGDKINGVSLDAKQLDDYARIGGRLAHAKLEADLKLPGWASISLEGRRAIMQSDIRKQHEVAANIVKMQSIGGTNDIIKQAADAKRAKAALRQPVPEVVQ